MQLFMHYYATMIFDALGEEIQGFVEQQIHMIRY